MGIQEQEKPKRLRPGDEGHHRLKAYFQQTLKEVQSYIQCPIDGCLHPGFSVYNQAINALPMCVNPKYINFCTDWNNVWIYDICESVGYGDCNAQVLFQLKMFQTPSRQ
eukprot:682076-Ditylum_brightwellii.AAC.1